MENLYRDAVHINMMADDTNKESAARAFFSKLNAMTLPEYFNWVEEVFEGLHVRERGDHKALIWTDIADREVKTYTYRELAVQGNKCLNALRRAGIEKGDNMVMMVPIVPETWFAGLACIKGGVVAVPTAATMTLRELQFRFESYPPDAVLCDAKFTDLMDEAIRATGVKPKIKIVLGVKTNDQKGWTSYADLDGEPETAEAARTRSHDLLFCFFTSGTTGLPKKVGHTAVSYPVGHLSTTLLTGIRPDDVHHNLSAPGWAKWSWSSFFAPFNVGATATGFNFTVLDGKKYLEAVAAHKVSVFCAPPTAWRMFINLDISRYDLSSLRQSVGAGEPLNPEVITQWKKHTGTEIRDFYGQTESTAMIGNPSWMTGRMKSGPFEVESALVEHSSVAEAAVIGAPDPKRHQLVKAYVILNPEFKPSRELALELFRHTIKILAKFKIPRIIEFVEQVPKTISGKIRRIELRENEVKTGPGANEFFYPDFPELSSKKP